jgi:hypothetical protein
LSADIKIEDVIRRLDRRIHGTAVNPAMIAPDMAVRRPHGALFGSLNSGRSRPALDNPVKPGCDGLY